MIDESDGPKAIKLGQSRGPRKSAKVDDGPRILEWVVRQCGAARYRPKKQLPLRLHPSPARD